MKHFYEAPDAQVINLAAMQPIALLDGNPHEAAAANNTDDMHGSVDYGVGEGTPDF